MRISNTGATANHDTERNGNSLNTNSPNNNYVLATIFSLSYPYGTPTVLSSYSYSTTDDGAPNGGTFITISHILGTKAKDA